MLKFSSAICFLSKLLVFILICSILVSNIDCNSDEPDEFAEFDDEAPTSSDQRIDATKNLRPKSTASNQNDAKQADKSSVDERKPSRGEEEEEVSKSNSEGSKVGSSGEKRTLEESSKESNPAPGPDDSKTRKPDLKLVNAPAPRQYNWESYYIEIGFIILMILYIVNYFLGSSKNQAFAFEWHERTRDLMKQQFTLVGGSVHLTVAGGANGGGSKQDDDQDQVSTKKQKGLIKSSESVYTLWMSGRVGVDGLLVELNLLKRQDLFSMALYLLKPARDTVKLRFLLNQDGYENFVFCLAHKSWAQKLARDMVDISTFCPKRKPISQYGVDSERLFVMSELSDVVPFILDSKTNSFVKKYEQSINFIHITDQYSSARPNEDIPPAHRLDNAKRMATFSFALPQNDSDRTELITFALSLLDRLRRFKLARDSKQKSEKNRQKITDIIEKTKFSLRQEAAQAKKDELRRLEKERIYTEDDPEKQKRWEKKEAKRELKKNKMRVKQLKVRSM